MSEPLIIKPVARGKHRNILLAPAKKPAHVHGPGCGHDHGHDAAHEAHDEPDEHHEHHEGCGHDHGSVRKEPRPPQARPAETGGPALQLALDEVLPEERDEHGIFQHFEQQVHAHRAVSEVHIRRDAGRAEICIHYDADVLSLIDLIELARRAGADVTARFERAIWYVRGLESAQAGAALEKSLASTPGVLHVAVAFAAERLVVELDTEATTVDAIARRVEELGYRTEVPEAGHACSMHAHGGGGLAPQLQMPLAIGAGVILAITWPIERWATGVPAIVPTIAYVVAMIAAAVFPVRAALGAIRARQVDVETLMILAGVGAAAIGAWFEGAFLLFLFTLGHALEHRATDRARRSIEALGALAPKTARVRRGDDVVEVEIASIELGDRIVVRAGDRIPLDGVIHTGQSLVDQATITGESVPVPRGPGEKVFAGTINTEAVLEIDVSSLAGDTLLARIVDMVTEAEAQKGTSQRFAQRLERVFAPLVVVIAALVPLLLIATGTGWRDALLRGVALIVAASPCALAIATPSAVLAAVARAARGGVLIKGGAHLENLGKVRAIAFDKTGTLTHGKPRLVSVEPAAGVTADELLATAAALESLSNHPLANAVIEGAAAREIAAQRAEEGDAVHGKGIQGRIGDDRVRIGNRAMFDGDDVPAPLASAAEALEAKGQTTMLVWRAGRFLGVLGVADTMRDDAKRTIARLGELGIETTVMLSGDNLRCARAIADQVGIREVKAPLLPEDKVTEVRALASRGGVAMIGDGVNDAPALAAASVGVAMGGTGSDAALETADIVLLGDSLDRLPFAVGLARRATGVIRQNLVLALGVSAILVTASAIGWASIAQAVIFHEGSTLLVVANALWLLRYRDA